MQVNSMINSVWQSTREGQEGRYVKVLANADGYAYVRNCDAKGKEAKYPAGHKKAGELEESRQIKTNLHGTLPGYRRVKG